LTTSGKLLRAVQREISRQLPKAGRREFIARVLDRNAWLIEVSDVGQGIELANRLAPEHLEIMTRDAAHVARQITTAGAIFLGVQSPTVLGDYVAGPSHTLPAGGTGASFAGLTVDQFQRRSSLIAYGKPALRRALKTVRKFAELEGLDAHGRSAEIRLKATGKG
jgi:histidinol dehydrogenase